MAALGVSPGPAIAATEAEAVTVTGVGLSEPIEVTAEDHPDLCASLYAEISWLVRKDPTADEPDPETLGDAYTMVVRIDGEPRHEFDLYPHAEGGPRVFRPAEQPGDREVDEGWYLGRLSMPETLAAAGVPLDEDDRDGPGGAGGGSVAPEQTAAPERGVFGFLADWREGMQLTLLVTVAIVVGLAGVALLIRRKV